MKRKQQALFGLRVLPEHQGMYGNPHQRSANCYLSPKAKPEWERALARLPTKFYQLPTIH